MSLIKSQLIQNITEANPHLFVRDVERIVNTIFNEFSNSLASGKRVELRGFGAFSVQHRNERRGWETYPKWTGGSPLHILETVCAQFGDAVITCSWPEKQ